MLAATIVVRQGAPAAFPLRSPAGADVRLELRLEGGADAPAMPLPPPAEDADGVVERRVQLPAGLPLGDHR